MDELIDLDNMTEQQMESLVDKAMKKADAFHTAMYDWLCRWAYVGICEYTQQQKTLQRILKQANERRRHGPV